MNPANKEYITLFSILHTVHVVQNKPYIAQKDLAMNENMQN